MTPDDLKRAGVRVRKLQWAQGDGVVSSRHFTSAETAFATYEINTDTFCWWIDEIAMDAVQCASVEAAKAAAQQHYENAILLALEPIHE